MALQFREAALGVVLDDEFQGLDCSQLWQSPQRIGSQLRSQLDAGQGRVFLRLIWTTIRKRALRFASMSGSQWAPHA